MLHVGPVEFLYYWLHRALHYSYLFSRYLPPSFFYCYSPQFWRKIVPLTYSLSFVCLVFLCKGLKVKDFGHHFALMRLFAWQIVGVLNLRNCIPNMRERARPKSNQQNLGTIKSSNLGSEIIEYTSPRETAVCKGKRDPIEVVTKVVTANRNKIIVVNYYPVETAKMSNLRHRPIGIGVQGLADAFILLGMEFDSPKAQQLNKEILETI